MAAFDNFPGRTVQDQFRELLVENTVIINGRRTHEAPLTDDTLLQVSDETWGTSVYGQLALDFLNFEREAVANTTLIGGSGETGLVTHSSWWSHHRLKDSVTTTPMTPEAVLGKARQALTKVHFPFPLQTRVAETSSTHFPEKFLAFDPLPTTRGSLKRGIQGYIGDHALHGAFGKAYETLAIAADPRVRPREDLAKRFVPDETWVSWQEVENKIKQYHLTPAQVETLYFKLQTNLLRRQIITGRPAEQGEAIFEGACFLQMDDPAISAARIVPEYVSRETFGTMISMYTWRNVPAHFKSRAFLDDLASPS